MTEPSPTGSTRTPRTSGDQARAAIWRGILGAAKHLGKRVPLQAAPRPFVVQLREGNRKTPVYFIGNGLVEYNLAQSVSSDCAIFAVEIPWPAAWHDACARNFSGGITDHRTDGRVIRRGHQRAPTLFPVCTGGILILAELSPSRPRTSFPHVGIQVETVILLDVAVTFPSLRDAAWQKLLRNLAAYIATGCEKSKRRIRGRPPGQLLVDHSMDDARQNK